MSTSLIDQAVERISRRLGAEIRIEEVLVDISERAAFRTTIRRKPAVVKIDSVIYRGEREAIALRAAGPAGLPVPRILYRDPNPPPILVLTFIPGKQEQAPVTPSPWMQAGAVLRGLHDLPIPQGLPQFDWFGSSWQDFLLAWSHDCIDCLGECPGLSPRLLGSLENQMVGGFQSMPEPARVFLHGDCQFDHFILSPGGRRVRTLIDFGDAGSGDPMWDIATLVLWAPAEMHPVLTGYDADYRMFVHAISTIRPYVILRHIAAIGWLIENGFDPSSHLEALQRYG